MKGCILTIRPRRSYSGAGGGRRRRRESSSVKFSTRPRTQQIQALGSTQVSWGVLGQKRGPLGLFRVGARGAVVRRQGPHSIRSDCTCDTSE